MPLKRAAFLTLISGCLIMGQIGAAYAENKDQELKLAAPKKRAKQSAPNKDVTKYTAPARNAAGENDQTTAGGWNLPWALLFSVNHLFGDGGFLSTFEGGVAGQYSLRSNLAVRGTLNFSRFHNPQQVEQVTVDNGNEQVVEFEQLSTPDPTSSTSLALGGDVLYRFLQGAVSPYAGGGMDLSWQGQQTNTRDEASVDNQVTIQDNTDNRVGLGLRGILGVGWRFHPNFALFAEYSMRVGLVNHRSYRNETVVQNSSGGDTSSTREVRESSYTRWGDFNTALGHGADLGLAIYF